MNVNFNYNESQNDYKNATARNDRALMRILKLPYTFENNKKMQKVRQVMRSISDENAQKWRFNSEISNALASRIKRDLKQALGRRANNRDVDAIFTSKWNGVERNYIANANIFENNEGRHFGFKNVDKNDVVGRLAKKFGRDTSKAELTRFKNAFFTKIKRDTPLDLGTLKTILRRTPRLNPEFGDISFVNNLTGQDMEIRAIRNAARHVYGQNNQNNMNNNSDVRSVRSNSNSAANYVANVNRVRRNAIRNAVNRNITWETKVVNTPPRDAVSLQNFKNGSKVVNIGFNRYVSPATFRALARTSMIQAYNRNGNAVLFKNPFTRQNMKRSNVKFVVLRTKNAAARKIQQAFRSRPKSKMLAAAIKRRRTTN
jgi:hypothetical protein